MRRGSANKKAMSFAAMRVAKFVPHIFTGGIATSFGCGATALALLTGIHPAFIPRPRKGDWTERIVTKYLKDKDFRVLRMTLNNITPKNELLHPVGRTHVSLLRLKFMKNEASWIVVHNSMVFHNFEITELEAYEFINHPILAGFLLWHEDWM